MEDLITLRLKSYFCAEDVINFCSPVSIEVWIMSSPLFFSNTSERMMPITVVLESPLKCSCSLHEPLLGFYVATACVVTVKTETGEMFILHSLRVVSIK